MHRDISDEAEQEQKKHEDGAEEAAARQQSIVHSQIPGGHQRRAGTKLNRLERRRREHRGMNVRGASCTTAPPLSA